MDPSVVGVVVGAVVGGLFTLLGAHVNARSQERAASLRAKVDIQLQADRLHDAATSAELALRRAKLEDLRSFLSEVAEQCSRTQATQDKVAGLAVREHSIRWAALVSRLHQARAAADVYFPSLSEGMGELAGCIELFGWRTYDLLAERKSQGQEIDEALAAWGRDKPYVNIIEASEKTSEVVREVGRAIAKEAEHLAAMRPLQ